MQVDSFDWYFEFTRVLKASAKRNIFLYLSMKKEHVMKAWSVVLYACALSLMGSLQESESYSEN